MNSIIELTDYYSSNNYAPLKLVISKGKGVKVWDTDGKQYIDCISGFQLQTKAIVIQQLLKAMTEQASKLSIISRVLYSDNLGKWEEKICHLAKKDKVLPLTLVLKLLKQPLKLLENGALKLKALLTDKLKSSL